MKRLFLLGTLLFGLTLAAGAAWLAPGRGIHSPGVYTLATVEHGRLAEMVSASGVVQPRRVYTVGTELAGKVVAVPADFNREVSEGEVLLRLDDQVPREKLRQAELAIEAAQVGIKQAETARDAAHQALRRETARSREVRRQADVDLVQSQARAAEIAVEAAQVKLREAREAHRQAERLVRQTVVRTPTLAGEQLLDTTATRSPQRPHVFTILERRVSVNQVIGPPTSAHLFTLAGDLTDMQVQAQVAEGDVHKMRRGLEGDFALPGGEEAPAFRGTISEVRLAPTPERGAVYYKVLFDVRNRRDPVTKEWLLRPGLTTSVDIGVRVHEAAWKLPAAALNFKPDERTLSPAAVEKSQQAGQPSEAEQWRTVWTVGDEGRPWPLRVRLGGRNARGETGIQDAQFSEILEWEADLRPRPNPRDPATFPQLIIGTTAKKGGFFNPPTMKF